MKKIGYILLIVIVSAIGATFFVKNVQAAKVQLFTLTGFIDELIEKGIIDQKEESKAREIVSMIANIEKDEVPEALMNAGNVEVKVSQLIENSNRTYNRFENIEGIILLVENISDTQIELEAKRRCQVVYRIKNDEGDVLYDSRNKEKCQTNEKGTFLLNPGQTRMFKVEHEVREYELTEGQYTFEIEFPGYGGGEKVVTIL